MLQDFRYALRALLSNKGFASASVLTLALGIGANCAIFSLVNAVLLKPFPYPHQDRLVEISAWSDEQGLGPMMVNAQWMAEFMLHARSFEAVSGYQASTAHLSYVGEGEPERVSLARILAGHDEMLGMRPVLGRTFLPEEYRPGGEGAALISYGLWQRRLGAQARALEEDLLLDGKAYRIVGVLPPEFRTPIRRFDVFLPLPAPPQGVAAISGFFQPIARLGEGVSLSQAQQETAALAAESDRRNSSFFLEARLQTLHERIAGRNQRPLALLFMAVLAVLLIACANVTSLALSRNAGRRREAAMRLALGAGRLRLVRQLLTESLLLALLGTALGLALALALLRVVQLADPGLPRLDGVGLNLETLSFAAAVLVAVTLIVGIAPALRLSKAGIDGVLRQSSRGKLAGGEREGLFAIVTTAEVALALMLLFTAGLMLKSFANLMAVDPGFRIGNTLSLDVRLPDHRLPQANQKQEAAERILARLNSLPAVQSAGATLQLPLSRSWSKILMSEDETPDHLGGMSINSCTVTDGYFESMGIPLLAGRTVQPQDREGAAPVAVVSRGLAQLFWPGEDPIGQEIRGRRIVGVVDDVRHYGLDQPHEPTAYIPLRQDQSFNGFLQIVVRGGEGRIPLGLGAIKSAIHQEEPEVPIVRVGSLDSLVSSSRAGQRFQTGMLSAFALSAVLLSTLGIYGVLSHWVARRRWEIGLRMAVGAEPRRILARVVARGMAPALSGIALGLAGSWAAARFLGGMLYEVGTADATVTAAVPLALAAIALAACWIPARRATRVDPARTLRQE